MGALYVRRDLIPTLEPPKLGGRAAASYDHEGNWVPARDQITKFELTTISGPALAGAVAATEQYLALGQQAVWDRVRALNRYAEQRFARIPRVTVTSPQREETRTGLFSFALAGEEPAKVSAYLQQQARVVCRYVGEIGAVRLSLHCYNTEADIETAAQAIEQASRDGLPGEVAAATPWERQAQERT
jgi:selenocysteine lyase/cysteine desulfurase